MRTPWPDTQVVALTSVLEDRLVFDAIRVGAMGYLLKDTRGHELCRAIKAAAAGQVQLSPEAARRLVGHVAVREDINELTPRETEVLRHVSRGLANKQIGHALGITEKTVKTHVTNILSKLGVLSRTEAALYAVKAGLVSLDEHG